MPLASLLEQTAFDADTTARLTAAFDEAWAKVQSSGVLIFDAQAMRTLLAGRIIDQATQGELDVARLVEDGFRYVVSKCSNAS
jgi:hypothetical protein